MHGARADTPVTCIENVSRHDQRAFVSDLSSFTGDLDAARFDGPLMFLVGIAARTGAADLRVVAESEVALVKEVAHVAG
jgi:uroporphyrin-III C-methyltransferase/precorrin-2 dehydrogenase/sirohydrochlorin ferrochelatase